MRKATLAALLALLLLPAAAQGSARLHPAPAGVGEVARTARYWTAARMLAAAPLDAPAAARLGAQASFAQVAEPTVSPFTVNGRLFVRQGKGAGFCSATAIDTPSRKLVLTAGHCINSGPQPPNGHNVWSSFLEFVPAYSGAAPFGALIAHPNSVFALEQWVKTATPTSTSARSSSSPTRKGSRSPTRSAAAPGSPPT